MDLESNDKLYSHTRKETSDEFSIRGISVEVELPFESLIGTFRSCTKKLSFYTHFMLLMYRFMNTIDSNYQSIEDISSSIKDVKLRSIAIHLHVDTGQKL